jgi:hypothetical protein
MEKRSTAFIGLDVSKESIAIGVAMNNGSVSKCAL